MDPSGILGNSSLPLTMSLSAHLRELAYVRRNPIEGRKPVFAHLSRPAGSSSTIKIAGSLANNGNALHGKSFYFLQSFFSNFCFFSSGANGESSKTGEFMYYDDSDDEDYDYTGIGVQPKSDKLSCNFVDCLGARAMGLPSIGGNRFFPERLSSEYGTRHMLSNGMMKETSIYMPNMDKIFCSKWLSHRQVVFGTKCNKLMVFDVNTRHMDQIPSLPSSENSSPPEADCGIHAIEINPSRTLLATGGVHPNDIAVYRLPTLDPICVGRNNRVSHCWKSSFFVQKFNLDFQRKIV